MRAAGKYWTGSVRPQVEKAGGVPALALLVLVVLVATSGFLYLHEWGHAFGFWLDGLAPCVGLNSSWPAPPNEDVITLMGGLFGPLLGMGLGLLFLEGFTSMTYTVSSFTANCTFIKPRTCNHSAIAHACRLNSFTIDFGKEYGGKTQLLSPL